MADNKIITIGRQYGSLGYDIAKLLAEKMQAAFYDKELLKEAAKQSGLCEEVFHDFDEKPTTSFLYSLVMDPYAAVNFQTGNVEMPLNHRVFLAAFDTIKNIAARESAVFVGRCADYALEGVDGCLNVFIYAPVETRIAAIMESRQVKQEKARDIINKADKRRAAYYNYYTTKKWGHPNSYDICIDSSLLGVEGTADLIMDVYRKRFGC